MSRRLDRLDRAKDIFTAVLIGAVILGVIALIPKGLPKNLQGRVHVIDGDSLRLSEAEIRLQGIDAPEGRQTCHRNGEIWACGEAATRALEQKIGSGEVICEPLGYDRYDRVLARCKVSGEDLNAWMVANGWAVEFGSYQAEERQARHFNRGLWGSEFELPQAWRDRHRGRI